MPFPLVFIAIAAASGSVGTGKLVKAGCDKFNAGRQNRTAEEIAAESEHERVRQKDACSLALEALGDEKMHILNHSLKQFTGAFLQIKSVDFHNVEEFSRLPDVKIDRKEFEELDSMVVFAGKAVGGLAAGTAGGILTAFGAGSTAQMFAAASSGTAIASLHGAAATNATLAFFGGGSLAAGGGGMALGAAVLGALALGPALMAAGFIVGGSADKELKKAESNMEEALKYAQESQTACEEYTAIRRRARLSCSLLARLDSWFMPLVYQLEDIVKNEGVDYASYAPESKKVVAACASAAVTIKSILNTPLIDKEGRLTEESAEVMEKSEAVLEK